MTTTVPTDQNSVATNESHHGQTAAGAEQRTMDPIDAGATASAPVEEQSAVTDPAIKQPSPEPTAAAGVAEEPKEEPDAKPVTEAGTSELRWSGPLLSTQKNVVFSKPHHNLDLIDLYKVTSTASRVMRFDPLSGEKINKLRKSYEGQIKSFQLAGRNRAIKYESSVHGMSLLEMAQWPEVEWQNQKVSGKELSRGLSNSSQSLLDKAVKLEPGPVPRNDEWENILGHEKVKQGGPPSPKMGSKGIDAVGSKKPARTNGVFNGGSQDPGGDSIRARRTGKRRRYDDDSFEGYGEGFVDDDREEAGGYSSDDRSSKKKRRKSYNGANPGMGGYGMGVSRQSIGSGIGAFGAR